MVETLHDDPFNHGIQLRHIQHLVGAWITVAPDGDEDHVVMTVPVGIVALAEDGPVFLPPTIDRYADDGRRKTDTAA